MKVPLRVFPEKAPEKVAPVAHELDELTNVKTPLTMAPVSVPTTLQMELSGPAKLLVPVNKFPFASISKVKAICPWLLGSDDPNNWGQKWKVPKGLVSKFTLRWLILNPHQPNWTIQTDRIEHIHGHLEACHFTKGFFPMRTVRCWIYQH